MVLRLYSGAEGRSPENHVAMYDLAASTMDMSTSCGISEIARSSSFKGSFRRSKREPHWMQSKVCCVVILQSEFDRVGMCWCVLLLKQESLLGPVHTAVIDQFQTSCNWFHPFTLTLVTDRHGRQAGGTRQVPSNNQTPAHSCRPVHTGAISKWLASVTQQGSLMERFYRLMLVNAEGNPSSWRHLYAWNGITWYDCLHNTPIYRAAIAPVCTQLDA